MIVLERGNPHGLRGVGLQGHEGQFLGMLAQWKVMPQSPMHIDGKDFTVSDFIEEEKATFQSGTELTFKLIALRITCRATPLGPAATANSGRFPNC